MVGIGDLLTSQNGRPDRFDDEAFDGRVVFFESGHTASKGAGRSEEITESADTSPSLAKYFLCCMKIVGAGAAGEAKLIGSEGFPFLYNALSFSLDQFQIFARDLARCGVGHLIDKDDLCSQGRHHA